MCLCYRCVAICFLRTCPFCLINACSLHVHFIQWTGPYPGTHIGNWHLNKVRADKRISPSQTAAFNHLHFLIDVRCKRIAVIFSVPTVWHSPLTPTDNNLISLFCYLHRHTEKQKNRQIDRERIHFALPCLDLNLSSLQISPPWRNPQAPRFLTYKPELQVAAESSEQCSSKRWRPLCWRC